MRAILKPPSARLGCAGLRWAGLGWSGLGCAGLSKVAWGWAKMNLPASRCLSALAKLRWASVGLAGFALLLCAGLGCAALGWGGLSFTIGLSWALFWLSWGCLGSLLGLAGPLLGSLGALLGSLRLSWGSHGVPNLFLASLSHCTSSGLVRFLGLEWAWLTSRSWLS